MKLSVQFFPFGVVDPNRVAWAKTYLKKAGLLEAPRRGVFVITDRAKQVLAKILPR